MPSVVGSVVAQQRPKVTAPQRCSHDCDVIQRRGDGNEVTAAWSPRVSRGVVALKLPPGPDHHGATTP